MVDRKALTEAYRQRRPPMGVYRVMNSVTGHALVAAARDLPAILNRHQAQLRMGGHPSRVLQQDWRTHGPETFVFEVLDTLTPPDDPAWDPLDDLTVLEDMWLAKLSLAPDRQHTINPKRLR